MCKYGSQIRNFVVRESEGKNEFDNSELLKNLFSSFKNLLNLIPRCFPKLVAAEINFFGFQNSAAREP